MTTNTILTPRELGKVAYDEVRGSQPLMDDIFVEHYLTNVEDGNEQFKNMDEWLRGYKQAGYELQEQLRKADKKKSLKQTKQTKKKEKNLTPVENNDLPF